MALQKRTIKIIAIVAVTLLLIVAVLGIVLGLVLRSNDKVELEVLPRGPDGSKSPLISYKISDPNSTIPWTRRLNETIQEYRNIRNQSAYSIVNCDYNMAPLSKNQVCDVNVEQFPPCTAAYKYNYGQGKLCVFLRPNKVNWTPVTYNNTNELPKELPDDVKMTIKPFSGQPKMNEVWVSCEGEKPEDKEHIGTLKYMQTPGFPAYYFPYNGQAAYLSPLVAVVFENPQKDVLINVVCKAWAKNIACEKCEQTASVRFQIKVDN